MKELFGKKWILHIALALCFALAFVPVITHYASAGTAVASVTIGDTTTEYDSLDAAVQAVANCTAEDKAVIKLLQSIDFGEYGGIGIEAGVCTLDLNGRTLSHATVGVQNADVTIIDSHGGGAVIASEYWHAVSVGEQAVVTINGGTFTAYGNMCVVVYANGTGTALNIKAGTINCDNIGVYCAGGDLTISGGNINGEKLGLVTYECDSIDIRGGIISGGTYSWRINAAWEPWRVYKVNIVQDYMGATFSGDIDGGDYTLEALLGEGAAYWLNGEKVTLKKNQTVLTGGDIVVMNADGHRHIAETYTDNGEDHSFTCVTCGKEITNPHSYDEITLQCPCGNEITEPHNYDENTLLCACGAISADAVVLVSKNGVPTSGYTTLHDAIQAVSTATADDNAVVKLLKDIKLGMGYLYTEAGVFTIDLNGKTLSSTGISSALDVFYGDVTITDSGEGGMISAASCGISVYGNVTVESGTIHGDRAGIWVSGSLTVCGGTITGDDDGILVSEGQLMIYGGLIDGDGRGVYAEAAIVTISGGSIFGGDAISSWLTDVTITDGNIKGGFYGVAAVNSTVEIHGGTVEGAVYGVYMEDITEYYNAGSDTVTPESGHYLLISGGVVTGGDCAVYVAQSQSPVTISGGSISGGWIDIVASPDGVNVTLTVGENGTGPIFPGGIKVENATLPEIFGEDFVYWQDGKPVELAQGQTEISGGDVTVKNENMTVNILGDLSGDGDVDAEDLTILARHVAGIELLTGAALTNADVDGDGDVDANDLTQHARYVAGIITDWEEDED